MTDPSIYQYTDFRAYLRDWFAARQGRPSQNGFARRVPCSPALLSSVLKGTRNLGRARAERVANVLKHDAEQRSYFLDLVWFAEAESPADREASWQRIRARRRWDEGARLDEATHAIFTNWLLPVLLEMARWPDFQRDPAWIASRVRPAVSPDDVKEALGWLVERGLLDEGADGELAAAVGNLGTDHEARNPFQGYVLTKHHTESLELMKQRLPTSPPLERHYSTTTFACSADDVAALKRRIRRLVEITCAESESRDDPDRVMVLGVQLAPVAGAEEVLLKPESAPGEDETS